MIFIITQAYNNIQLTALPLSLVFQSVSQFCRVTFRHWGNNFTCGTTWYHMGGWSRHKKWLNGTAMNQNIKPPWSVDNVIIFTQPQFPVWRPYMDYMMSYVWEELFILTFGARRLLAKVMLSLTKRDVAISSLSCGWPLSTRETTLQKKCISQKCF